MITSKIRALKPGGSRSPEAEMSFAKLLFVIKKEKSGDPADHPTGLKEEGAKICQNILLVDCSAIGNSS